MKYPSIRSKEAWAQVAAQQRGHATHFNLLPTIPGVQVRHDSSFFTILGDPASIIIHGAAWVSSDTKATSEHLNTGMLGAHIPGRQVRHILKLLCCTPPSIKWVHGAEQERVSGDGKGNLACWVHTYLEGRSGIYSSAISSRKPVIDSSSPSTTTTADASTGRCCRDTENVATQSRCECQEQPEGVCSQELLMRTSQWQPVNLSLRNPQHPGALSVA